MRVKITKRQIDALTSGGILADEEVRGFVARKLPTRAVTYGCRYRDKTTGKQRWILALFGKEFAQRLMSWRIESASHSSC
jgi:hypothetical protein